MWSRSIGAGFQETLAPLGTALTEAQLGLLWKLSPAPLMCFDGDNAGQKAGVRAALRALPHVGPGRSLGFVTMPAGQDPDDLIRAGGAAAFEALLASARIPRRPALAARARGRAAVDARAEGRPQAAADGPCRHHPGPGRARAISLRAAEPVQRADPAAAGAPALDARLQGRARGRRPLPAPAPPDHGRSEGARPDRARAPNWPAPCCSASPVSRS